MLRRINDKGFQVSLKKEIYYSDKFVLFPTDKYSFRSFEDLIKFVEISFSILNKTNITGEIKEYMVKILSGISLLKSLQIKLASYEIEFKYIKEEYKKNLKQVINDMYKEVKFNEELVSILEMKEISLDKYDIYTDCETNKERTERENMGKDKPSPNKVSYAVDTDNLMIVFPEELKKEYNGYICAFLENKTGDFYTDLFMSLVTGYSSIKISKNTNGSNDITEQQVPINIAILLSTLVQLLVYFKNSTSFRDNKLYDFDKFEIDSRMEHALYLLNLELNRLKLEI